MKKLLLSILTIATFGAKAQLSYEWAKISGSSGTDYVYGIETDNQGNIYNVGTYTSPTNDFDPGVGVVTLPHAGNECGFIQKLDASGNLVWVKSLYTVPNNKQVITDVQIASNGDLYLTGNFKGTVDFDMGSGTTNLTSQNSGLNEDGFILKINDTGNLVWVKQFGGGASGKKASVQKITEDANGNVFATGFYEDAIDLDPGTSTQVFSASYAKEAFIVKLDVNGNYVWGEEIGAPTSVGGNPQIIGRDINIDSNGDVFVLATNNTSAGLEYTGDVNNTDLSTPVSNSGSLIIKLSNTDGSLLTHQILYGGINLGIEIELDNNDNVYLTGWNTSNFYMSPNTPTLIISGSAGNLAAQFPFILSLSNDLQTFRWGYFLEEGVNGSSNYITGRSYSLAINSQGKVTIGGFIAGESFDADPTSSVDSIINPYSGGRMMFVVTYDTNGNYIWAGAMRGNSNYSQIQTLHIDNNDNLYLGGYIESSSNHLNPFGSDTDISLAGGGRDPFLIKFTSCIVNIPDANFKAYLVGNTAINTNGDTEIQCSEASAFTGFIDCSFLSISDLTGIEAFTALTQLYCTVNSISNLDVTQNTALTKLYCNSNSLSSLDVTQNTALTQLYCQENSISSLDVTNNTALTKLHCFSNSISSLNVTQNTALTELYCHTNSLSSLDVTQNTALTKLYCNGNTISSLDASQNTALGRLFCEDNQLTTLNVANGNNANVSTSLFDATNNPNLTCIQVDNVAYSTTNWTNIDATASFSLNCNGSVGINEQDNQNNLTVYPNPVASQLTLQLQSGQTIEIVSIIDVTGKIVKAIVTNNNTIDVSNLVKGIYFLQIQTNKGMLNSKFIKE